MVTTFLMDDDHCAAVVLFPSGTAVSQSYLPSVNVPLMFRHVHKCLDSMHDQGFVHRDVKPGNIIVTFTEEGGGVRFE